MKIVPFKPEHATLIMVQQRQAMVLSHLTLPYLRELSTLGPAVTALDDSGNVLGSAGVAGLGFGVGALWGFASAESGRHFVRLDRCLRRLLEIPRLRRIEASTEVDFTQACRWLEMLGFQPEGVLRKYGPNGEDHMRYAKVA